MESSRVQVWHELAAPALPDTPPPLGTGRKAIHGVKGPRYMVTRSSRKKSDSTPDNALYKDTVTHSESRVM